MAETWNAFKRYHRSLPTFTQICQSFDANTVVFTKQYNKILRIILNSQEDTMDDEDDVIVSALAKAEGRLLEYCIARLVELKMADITKAAAARQIIKEVKKDGWDDDDDEFFDSIPVDEDVDQIFHSERSLNTSAFSLRGYKPFVFMSRKLQEWHRNHLSVRLVWQTCLAVASVLILAKIASYVGSLVLRDIASSVRNGIIGPLTNIILPTVSFGKSILVAPIGTITGLWISPANRAVATKMTIIADEIKSTGQSTAQLSDLAPDIALIPRTLSIARVDLIGVASIVRAGSWRQRYVVADHYDTILSTTDELNEISMAWTNEYNALGQTFEALLRDLIEEMERIHPPAIYTSALQIWLGGSISTYILGYFINAHIAWVGGASSALALVTAYCSPHDRRTTIDFCTSTLSIFPPTRDYMQEVTLRRARIIRDVHFFLSLSISSLQSLGILAETGVDLCSVVENRFGKIEKHVHEHQRSLNIELATLNAGSWSVFGLMFERSEKKVQRAELHLDLEDLGNVMSINKVANQRFSDVRSLIQKWKGDTKHVLEGLKRFEKMSNSGLRGTWTEWASWEDLKRDIIALWPLVEKMKELRETRSSKTRAMLAHVQAKAEECHKDALLRASQGKKIRPWWVCMNRKDPKGKDTNGEGLKD